MFHFAEYLVCLANLEFSMYMPCLGSWLSQELGVLSSLLDSPLQVAVLLWVVSYLLHVKVVSIRANACKTFHDILLHP